MLCKYCGFELAETAKICPNCGAACDDGQDSPTSSVPDNMKQSVQKEQDQYQEQKPRKKRILIIILSIIGSLIMVFIGKCVGKTVAKTLLNNRSSESNPSITENLTDSKEDENKQATIPQINQIDFSNYSRMYWIGVVDNVSEYQIVEYGDRSNKIKKITIILAFDKALYSKATKDLIDMDSFRNEYPSFATFSFSEVPGYWVITNEIDGIDQHNRIQEMVEKEILEFSEQDIQDQENEYNGLSADYYMQSILDLGGRKALISEEQYDFINHCSAYWIDSDDGFTEYQSVQYGDARIVKEIAYIYTYDKDMYNSPEAYFNNDDVRKEYPSFSGFSFSEDDDCWIVTITLGEIDQYNRLREMAEKGLVVLSTEDDITFGGLYADAYIQSILSAGGRKLDFFEQQHLGISILLLND